MKAEVHPPIKVILASMDERSTSRMNTIFKIIFKGRCQFAQGEDAHLGIVDLDGETDAWEKFQQQYPGLPAIVMSENPAEREGAIYIAKPAKLDLLWKSVLDLVTQSPSEEEVSSKVDLVKTRASGDDSETLKPDADTTGVNTAARALDTLFEAASVDLKSIQQTNMQDKPGQYYNPDNYLLGRILSSLKKHTGKQSIIYVQCWRNRQLILLPEQNRAYTDLTDHQLKNLGVATLSEEFTIEINHVSSAGKNELPASETAGLRSISIDYLIWDLALRTARGRVPEGTDLSMPLYLQSWPNFPRLPYTPYGMRIASLWAGSPRTLDNIALSLGVAQSDVYSFYSAAFATGLTVSSTHRENSRAMDREEKKSPTRGLLAAILRRLSK